MTVRSTVQMWRLGLFLAMTLGLIAGACTNSSDDPGIPSQQFATALELLNQQSGELFGRVVFPNGYSQRSSTLSLDGHPFVTQPDGRFWITGIPAGEHTLLVHVKGYEPLERKLTLTQGENLLDEALTLRTARGRVEGRVVTGTGHTASGVALHLTPEGGTTDTNTDGRFRFMGVGSGKYTLTVNDPRYQQLEQVFRLKSNETIDLGNIVLFRDPTRPVPETASLR